MELKKDGGQRVAVGMPECPVSARKGAGQKILKEKEMKLDSWLKGGKNKESPVVEKETKPDRPTNMEIITVLGDALKDIEQCAQKHGATILNGKILVQPNGYGFFDVHCKLSFSGDSHRGVFSYEALQYLDKHFKTPDL
jgi:hypothetical protein